VFNSDVQPKRSDEEERDQRERLAVEAGAVAVPAQARAAGLDGLHFGSRLRWLRFGLHLESFAKSGFHTRRVRRRDFLDHGCDRVGVDPFSM
jgi:hypothetical protein